MKTKTESQSGLCKAQKGIKENTRQDPSHPLSLLNLRLLNLLPIHIHRRSHSLRTSLSSNRSLFRRATTARLHTEGMSKRLLCRSRRKTGKGSSSGIYRFGMSIVSGEIIVQAIDAGGVGLAGALNA